LVCGQVPAARAFCGGLRRAGILEDILKKRLFGVIFLLLAGVIFLTACNRDDAMSFSTEELLYDFDYMMALMEETFPHFGVAERRGIDIRALAAQTRQTIANYPSSMAHVAAEFGIAPGDMPPMDANVFWSIVQNEFFSQVAPLGNIMLLDYAQRAALRDFYVVPGIITGLDSMQRLLVTFEGEDPPPFNEIETTGEGLPLFQHNWDVFDESSAVTLYAAQRAFSERAYEENPALYRFIFRREPIREEPPEVFTTERIDGRIAYINFNTFRVLNFRHYSWRIDRFFMYTQDYDHLIIDIRDNVGGRNDFWRMLIMFTLWNEAERPKPEVPLYAFFRNTEQAYELGQAHISTERFATRFVPAANAPMPLSAILAHNEMPALNAQDMSTLATGVRLDGSINYLSQSQLHFTQERMWIPRARFPFEGQIWLLTSENNVEAAAAFAYNAKYTGFATLVGEAPGGGFTSTVMTHFNLPNTGLIVRWDIDYLTDAYGRSLEEFSVQPHYANRPGMDALETVLEIIEERG